MYSRAVSIVFGIGFLIVAFGGGLAIALSPQPLMGLCRNSCWINSLLFAMFGDEQGKRALGFLWFSAGCAVSMFLLMRPRSDVSREVKDR
jgi:hypothetical protein